jgi:hypothetical protein
MPFLNNMFLKYNTRCFLLFLMIYISVTLTGQNNTNSISGVLIDNLTQQPVPYAIVYVNGTTNGCQSNENGEFILNDLVYPCQIVVTHVSYNTQAFEIRTKTDRIEITLIEKLNALNEIEIKEKRISQNESLSLRKFYIANFKGWFLGVDRWGQCAKLLNDSVLVFSKDSDSFSVSASSPLEIELPLLGYKLMADLVDFQITYNKAYLGEQCYFNAYYYFIPIIPKTQKKKERIEKNRLDAYYGSSLHFFRSLYENNLASNGYMISKATVDNGKTTYHPAILKGKYLEDSNKSKYLNLNGNQDSCFTVTYYYKNGIPVDLTLTNSGMYLFSRLFLLKNNCLIRSDGTVPDNSIMLDGTFGEKKVGAMLPENYYP